MEATVTPLSCQRRPPRRTFPLPMPKTKSEDSREYKIGDRILVSLSSGRIVEAVVKAVIQQNNETRLQVDYGFDETALVYLWQVRRD